MIISPGLPTDLSSGRSRTAVLNLQSSACSRRFRSNGRTYCPSSDNSITNQALRVLLNTTTPFPRHAKRTLQISCTSPARRVAEKRLPLHLQPYSQMYRTTGKGGEPRRSREWSPLLTPALAALSLFPSQLNVTWTKKKLKRQWRKEEEENEGRRKRQGLMRMIKQRRGKGEKEKMGYCKNQFWEERRNVTLILMNGD